MTDKIMAVLALTTMIAFLGVVVLFVPDLELIVLVLVVSALAIYDFWRTFRDRHNNDRSG